MKDGGPAFPYPANQYGAHDRCDGMSLRDWFAGQALPGLLNAAGPNLTPDGCEGIPADKVTQDDFCRHFAKLSYRYADAMLAERDKK